VWDLVIVGAGPAGCAAAAAALQAEPRTRVLIVDRSDFPRDKPCGDAIASAALALLGQLGVDPDALVAGYPLVRRFEIVSPGDVQVARTMREPLAIVPRLVFDSRLLELVRALGADFERRTVRRLEVSTDQAVVDEELHARVVIGADGAESVVRRAVGGVGFRRGAMAVAIRGYAPELPDQHGAIRITMHGQRRPSYAWSFPIGDGMANVGYGELPGTGSPTSRARLLDQLHTLLPGAAPDPDSLRAHRLPLSSWRAAVAAGRVLLAGDAQSLINPLTGEGIYHAVISGALAGRASSRGADAGAVYRRDLGRRLGRYFRHTQMVATASRWPAFTDALLRGASKDQRVFDDLVELGLHDGHLTHRLLRSLRPT
jgi:geranylgeranyl reductase family protein